MLYALTTADGITDVLHYWNGAVSIDHHRCCLTSFQLVLLLQTIKILYHIEIIEITIFAACDVIAQSILVRPTGNGYYYSFNSSKDISLLDCLGLQHSCCYHSIIPIVRVLRYINYPH